LSHEEWLFFRNTVCAEYIYYLITQIHQHSFHLIFVGSVDFEKNKEMQLTCKFSTMFVTILDEYDCHRA